MKLLRLIAMASLVWQIALAIPVSAPRLLARPAWAADSGKSQNASPASTPAANLAVTLTLEHNTIAQPFPARITLHFHNAGQDALWLYRHVRDPEDLDRALRQMAQINATNGAQNGSASAGGSSLVVRLEPAAPLGTQSWTQPPGGKVMASVAMPHPHLVKLAPGADDTEGCVVALNPGLVSRGGSDVPVWGHYHFAVVYKTSYSNGDALSRDLGVDIWQGEVTSNTVDIDLEAAPSFAPGSISGRVMNPNGQTLPGMQVSLTDGQSHVIGQTITGIDGNYAFDHLPLGTYWATARPLVAMDVTAAYDHAELRADATKATVNLVPLESEAYEPKQLWHKPVLLKVTSSAGAPLGGVAVETLYSNGPIAETVKGVTDSNGTLALDLIPGLDVVTLKHRKCPSYDQRIEVVEGDGIDGSILQYDCSTH
ncbi:MAG TPA: carboxypeptidase-like regulatory domain-containing protein [Terriglobia bacterium]|nr:carboxypeptidase-like regulatory domain-containing protein [Terriglobia bacterium]